ncbi:Cullin-9 [Drechslerella dactyloides]|uniref:Cullin-9 n=1 Tax=Drechslerella dactyloides TaxID=74499 RepID=A0AAD6IYR6_DREDA|nr:Cullin-9 [Drechslerella dactyloides]
MNSPGSSTQASAAAGSQHQQGTRQLPVTFDPRAPGKLRYTICLTLERCAEIGFLEGVRTLLELGEQVDGSSCSGDMVTKIKIFDNINSNLKDNETALMKAIRGGHVSIAELLLEKGADVRYSSGPLGTNPLLLAVQQRNEALATLLLRYGAPVNPEGDMSKYYGQNPLHIAATNGDVGIVRQLLKAGADINAQGGDSTVDAAPQGGTALHFAAFHGRSDVVEGLLEEGADVDAERRWHPATPLDEAAGNNHIDVARILLQHGAKPDGIPGSGYVPLVNAASRGYLDMAALLLEKQAYIEAPDTDGDPPLHSAAYNGYLEMVNLLLDHGADPRSRGGSGKTARWFAVERRHEAVAQLLKSRGANDDDPVDMVDDTPKGIRELGVEKILSDVEKAQEFLLDEPAIASWAQKLRFVTRDANDPHRYKIIEEDPDRTQPFVAVSYHRQSIASAGGGPGSQPQVHGTRFAEGASEAIRHARVGPDVISRSLSFAESLGIDRVWIDKECIDQDNPDEVQVAVHAIHLIFRRAAATVALLGKHIHAPDEIPALNDLLSEKPNTQTVRDRILGDGWFTGAWCAQEDASSDPSKLYYLVGWKDDVDISGDLWTAAAQTPIDTGRFGLRQAQTVFREWVIPRHFVWSMSAHGMKNSHIMVNQAISMVPSSQGSFSLLDENLEESEWWRRNPSISAAGEADGQESKPRELKMFMTSAYQILIGKRNLLVSDRLAILGNIGHYPIRINHRRVSEKRLGYAACVIATALQNGDLSLLFSLHRREAKSLGAGQRDTIHISWFPDTKLSLDTVLGYGSGVEMSYLNRTKCYNGDTVYVIGGKGLIRGLVWDLIPYDGLVEFSDIATEFLDQTMTTPSEAERARPDEVLLQIVLHQLLSTGQKSLAEIVVTCALRRRFNNPAEIYDVLSRLEAWVENQDDDKWPSALFNEEWRKTVWLQGRDTQPETVGDAIKRATPFLRGLYQKIQNRQPLCVGKCQVQTPTGESRELIGIFDVNPAEHRQVLTPLSNLEYEFGQHFTATQDGRTDYWCVEELAHTHPTPDEVSKAVGFLKGVHGLDSKVYRMLPISLGAAFWSPRLSRKGLLELNEAVGWRTIPLGRIMPNKLKGKQKAVVPSVPTPPRSPTDDDLPTALSALALEASQDVSDDDERVLEIGTIAVIYPEFAPVGRLGGSIELEVSPTAPIPVYFTLLDGGEDVAKEETAELSHLPPLSFEFQLPAGYPYDVAPRIRLSSSWLDNAVLRQLKAELVETWAGLRDQAIFACIDILQSAADRLFDMPLPLDVRVNQKEKIKTLEFDRATKVKKFNEGTFDCGVCLEPRKGVVCHRINQCGHVFCKPCLKEYYTAMIKEGDVSSVQCLNYSCGKDMPPEEVTDQDGNVHKIPRKPGAIAPAELQVLLEAEMVERYLKLKRKRAFESMKNVVYCPRSFCKGPALRDSGEDRLAICQDCSLAFCAVCGKTWHGYTMACRTDITPKTAAEEKEAKLTEEFLESNCTPCPTCLIPISKSGGCNHMYCSRCGTHFCLLCGAFLFPDNPYQHYNVQSSWCYNRLWEGVDEHGEIVAPAPAPPPPEEPPQPMMIQIVVPGQAPREVNLPPVPEPQPAVPTVEAADDHAEAAENPNGEGSSGSDGSEEEEEAVEEDTPPLEPLNDDDEAEFWVIYSRNECFSEGYNMLEQGLTIKEIADFLSDWAASINQHRKNNMGLGTYWRRLIEWRRKVRDPRLKNMQIDLGDYNFTEAAKAAALQTGKTEEAELQRRWWEMWHGGMRQLAAHMEWDEDEVAKEWEDILTPVR